MEVGECVEKTRSILGFWPEQLCRFSEIEWMSFVEMIQGFLYRARL